MSVLPRASREPVAVLIQPPRSAAAFRAGMPRSRRIAPAITNSATLRVFEKGALNMGMPWRSAASDLVSPDAEAPCRNQTRRILDYPRGELAGRTDAKHVDIAQCLDQLIKDLGGLCHHRRGQLNNAVLFARPAQNRSRNMQRRPTVKRDSKGVESPNRRPAAGRKARP